ncbi:MAG: protein translocase subunit SecD [Nitrosomonadales bacterium]|jgi:preprotein translocase subunit SecD|nr:protein translocase subunit SecD [Nitrosomonadales bacterium]MBT3917898.1 protein translocase subunit SecD [Nitrosomonadales bacterium]MBT4183207.1 protein translocase subunit SecD [Nitrosomonadales bacterium]MBT4571528.1 protein translocase subunit SecD [Nitrosomonadales bacterium]MBT4759102.1 protein translocase subunit SecD [Nitrosomonadales bacterium]
MNQYASWKYILILLSIGLSFLYVTPNFYGESFAVQVMPVKAGETIDSSTLRAVESSLNKANIQNIGISFENTDIKVKFKEASDQLNAKQVIEKSLGKKFVVALNLISNSPAWLSNLGALPMYLGLDLRGGVHFLMQLDLSKLSEKKNDGFLINVRKSLQKENVKYYDSKVINNYIQLKFKSEDSLNKAKNIIRDQGAGRSIFGGKGPAKETEAFNFSEIKSTNEFILKVKNNQYTDEENVNFALKQNLETLHNRVNELGVAEPIIQQQGKDRIVVQLPGVQDTAKAKEIIGRTAILEMRMVAEERSDPATIEKAENGQLPPGIELYYDRSGNPILVKKEVILTGERLEDASPGVDQLTGQSVVYLDLDSIGTNIFKEVTRANVGKRIALLLIEKNYTEVITAPKIKSEIGGGNVMITGMESAQESTDISLLLRAGSLSVPMEIVEERTVGPSMGKENIARGVNSTIWGFAAIVILMVAYYMFFGVVSVIGLSVNLLFLTALLSALQATLTLPGLAAIAITIGMAIDANVLINERIRDEIRNGMPPQKSISQGYDKAWGTILDSNITTMIAGLALFMFGSGPIKGFAVVLVLGILTSMYSAIFVSRGIVNYIYGNKRTIKKISIGEIFKIDNN